MAAFTSGNTDGFATHDNSTPKIWASFWGRFSHELQLVTNAPRGHRVMSCNSCHMFPKFRKFVDGAFRQGLPFLTPLRYGTLSDELQLITPPLPKFCRDFMSEFFKVCNWPQFYSKFCRFFHYCLHYKISSDNYCLLYTSPSPRDS